MLLGQISIAGMRLIIFILISSRPLISISSPLSFLGAGFTAATTGTSLPRLIFWFFLIGIATEVWDNISHRDMCE